MLSKNYRISIQTFDFIACYGLNYLSRPNKTTSWKATFWPEIAFYIMSYFYVNVSVLKLVPHTNKGYSPSSAFSQLSVLGHWCQELDGSNNGVNKNLCPLDKVHNLKIVRQVQLNFDFKLFKLLVFSYFLCIASKWWSIQSLISC